MNTSIILWSIIIFQLFKGDVMEINADLTNTTTIHNGMIVPNAVEISGDTLLLMPVLDGIGNVSWFFETPRNELIVIDFRWSTKSDAKVMMHSKYIRTADTTINFSPDLEYKFHIDEHHIIEKSWVELVGELDDKTIVDIKINGSFWTDPQSKEFNKLIGKYNLQLKWK